MCRSLHLECQRAFEVKLQSNKRLQIGPGNSASGYLSEGKGNTNSEMYLYPHTFTVGSFIYNSQDTEGT